MHARRGFERAYVAGDARGATVLTLVQTLYAVERQAQEAGLSPEARLTLRLTHSLPVYEELFGLLEQWAPHVPAKTPLGKAIAYARNRALPLGRFLEDGRLPLDNGEVERLIKLIVLGRKNWLFLGSDAAGHRAASVYSLVLSCYATAWACTPVGLLPRRAAQARRHPLPRLPPRGAPPRVVGPAAGSAALGLSTRRPSRGHRATLLGGRHPGLDRRLTALRPV